jgi:putative redox protein
VADVDLELIWEGRQRFAARDGELALTLDGERQAGMSPVQALAAALGGCMAIDVVSILEKGRLDVRGLRLRLEAERNPKPTRSLAGVKLHFEVQGDIPADRVERAIALSRETYCSVWHSLHPATPLETRFEVVAGP